MQRYPAATELAPPLAATYARLGRRQEAHELLLRWRPGASEYELSRIGFADYPLSYPWSPQGQEAADRFVDGLIIAALPPDVTVGELIGSLNQGGPFERAHTARTLGRFGPLAADAVPALIDALQNPSPVVRGAAISALGKIGPQARSAVPALTAIQDSALRTSAKDAVKAIAGR